MILFRIVGVFYGELVILLMGVMWCSIHYVCMGHHLTN